jgi:hypothetical protein
MKFSWGTTGRHGSAKTYDVTGQCGLRFRDFAMPHQKNHEGCSIAGNRLPSSQPVFQKRTRSYVTIEQYRGELRCNFDPETFARRGDSPNLKAVGHESRTKLGQVAEISDTLAANRTAFRRRNKQFLLSVMPCMERRPPHQE